MTGAELRAYVVEVADVRLSLTGRTSEADTIRLEAVPERGAIHDEGARGWVYVDRELGRARLVRVCKASGRERYLVEFLLWDLARLATRIPEDRVLRGLERPARTGRKT